MKILIMRFSSFGDIAQCLSCLRPLKKKFPQAEIHFLTKEQFAPLVALDPDVDQVLSFGVRSDLSNLSLLAKKIKESGYTHVYDAHKVLRTRLLWLRLLPWLLMNKVHYLVRPKNRWKRFLYFFFRLKTFTFPFYGAKSYLEPLAFLGVAKLSLEEKNWKFTDRDLALFDEHHLPQDYFVFAPSAAWEMKRWPISHWQELLKTCHAPVVFLGGKEDTFIEEIIKVRPNQTFNLAGKIDLRGSALVIRKAKKIVSADTGVLHLADLMNKKTVALMGPTAFGYPSSSNAIVLDLKLDCAPCTKDGRGRCSNSLYQRCMVEITPQMVGKLLIKD